MYHNTSFQSFIIKAGVHTFDAERQAMFANICLPGDVKTQAALQGFGSVGKPGGIFTARIFSMGHISIRYQGAFYNINDIKPFFSR